MRFHPVSKIFPMMTAAEYHDLKDDIAKNGLLEPILTFNDQIIDGRNRFNACKELGIKPKFKKWKLNGTPLVDFIIALNLKRRHLTKSQIAMVAVDALPFFEKEARKRQKLSNGRGKKGVEIVPHLFGRSRNQAGNAFGVSGRYVQHAKSIKEKDPVLANQIRNGELTIKQGIGAVKRQERVNSLRKEGRRFKSNHHVKIVHADFYKWCMKNLEPNSIDLILTDPPYSSEYIDLWEKLAEIAKRVLKPSKWLVAYTVNGILPLSINALSKHLKYWSTYCLHYKGANRYKFNTSNTWKPILIYHKHPLKLPKYSSDYLEGGGRDKTLHDWQQDEKSVRHLIEIYSSAGDSILDPMAGSGTVIKVAKELKRKCIGIDSDKKCVEMIRGRVK